MHEYIPLLVALVLLAMGLAGQRLNRVVQPMRLEFAEKSQALLGNPKLPTHLGEFVRSMQSTAFGARPMLILSIAAIPIFALVLLADPTLVEKASKRFWIECRETRAQFDEVNRLHNRILFFNNPILLLIVLTELLVFLAPAILLHGIFRGALSVRINSDVALNLVEEKSIKIAGAVPRLNFAH